MLIEYLENREIFMEKATKKNYKKSGQDNYYTDNEVEHNITWSMIMNKDCDDSCLIKFPIEMSNVNPYIRICHSRIFTTLLNKCSHSWSPDVNIFSILFIFS